MFPEEKSVIRFRGTDNAKIVRLIRTVAPMGAGTETDPVRRVYQYWSLDGELLFTEDDYLNGKIEETRWTCDRGLEREVNIGKLFMDT